MELDKLYPHIIVTFINYNYFIYNLNEKSGAKFSSFYYFN